jgi:hypothetical protein
MPTTTFVRIKKDIIISEIQACERMRNYTRDKLDIKAIESEIAELMMTLDLLPNCKHSDYEMNQTKSKMYY